MHIPNVWPGVVAAGVLPVVEYRHQRGRTVDVIFKDEETPRSVHVAQVVAQALAFHGVEVPGDDETLVRYLERHGRRAPEGALWTVARLPDNRVGVVSPAGVVESTGDALVLVEHPETGRYVDHWCIPGVHYGGHERIGGHGVSDR